MKETIRKIYHHLLLNKAYISDVGLYFGKTGCLLFFAHYCKCFKNVIHEEIVSETIDEIFSQLVNISSFSMRNGLCGIGWGIEYLLQNQLMEGNSDEILEELDSKIFNKDIKFIESHPDFADILHYVVIRLTSSRL